MKGSWAWQTWVQLKGVGIDTSSRRCWKLRVRLELENWSGLKWNTGQPGGEGFADIKGQSQETESCKWSRKEQASLVAQTVKNLPAVQETLVQSLGWEDPLEEGMATHSSILAWRIPWIEDPGRLQSIGLQRVRHTTERLLLFRKVKR